jgi:hypothetical protein
VTFRTVKCLLKQLAAYALYPRAPENSQYDHGLILMYCC